MTPRFLVLVFAPAEQLRPSSSLWLPSFPLTKSTALKFGLLPTGEIPVLLHRTSSAFATMNIHYAVEHLMVQFLSSHSIEWITAWVDFLVTYVIDGGKLHPDLLIRDENRVLIDGCPKWDWQEWLQSLQSNPEAHLAWNLCQLESVNRQKFEIIVGLTYSEIDRYIEGRASLCYTALPEYFCEKCEVTYRFHPEILITLNIPANILLDQYKR